MAPNRGEQEWMAGAGIGMETVRGGGRRRPLPPIPSFSNPTQTTGAGVGGASTSLVSAPSPQTSSPSTGSSSSNSSGTPKPVVPSPLPLPSPLPFHSSSVTSSPVFSSPGPGPLYPQGQTCPPHPPLSFHPNINQSPPNPLPRRKSRQFSPPPSNQGNHFPHIQQMDFPHDARRSKAQPQSQSQTQPRFWNPQPQEHQLHFSHQGVLLARSIDNSPANSNGIDPNYSNSHDISGGPMGSLFKGDQTNGDSTTDKGEKEKDKKRFSSALSRFWPGALGGGGRSEETPDFFSEPIGTLPNALPVTASTSSYYNPLTNDTFPGLSPPGSPSFSSIPPPPSIPIRTARKSRTSSVGGDGVPGLSSSAPSASVSRSMSTQLTIHSNEPGPPEPQPYFNPTSNVNPNTTPPRPLRQALSLSPPLPPPRRSLTAKHVKSMKATASSSSLTIKAKASDGATTMTMRRPQSTVFSSSQMSKSISAAPAYGNHEELGSAHSRSQSQSSSLNSLASSPTAVSFHPQLPSPLGSSAMARSSTMFPSVSHSLYSASAVSTPVPTSSAVGVGGSPPDPFTSTYSPLWRHSIFSSSSTTSPTPQAPASTFNQYPNNTAALAPKKLKSSRSASNLIPFRSSFRSPPQSPPQTKQPPQSPPSLPFLLPPASLPLPNQQGSNSNWNTNEVLDTGSPVGLPLSRTSTEDRGLPLIPNNNPNSLPGASAALVPERTQVRNRNGNGNEIGNVNGKMEGDGSVHLMASLPSTPSYSSGVAPSFSKMPLTQISQRGPIGQGFPPSGGISRHVVPVNRDSDSVLSLASTTPSVFQDSQGEKGKITADQADRKIQTGLPHPREQRIDGPSSYPHPPLISIPPNPIALPPTSNLNPTSQENNNPQPNGSRFVVDIFPSPTKKTKAKKRQQRPATSPGITQGMFGLSGLEPQFQHVLPGDPSVHIAYGARKGHWRSGSGHSGHLDWAQSDQRDGYGFLDYRSRHHSYQHHPPSTIVTSPNHNSVVDSYVRRGSLPLSLLGGTEREKHDLDVETDHRAKVEGWLSQQRSSEGAMGSGLDVGAGQKTVEVDVRKDNTDLVEATNSVLRETPQEDFQQRETQPAVVTDTTTPESEKELTKEGFLQWFKRDDKSASSKVERKSWWGSWDGFGGRRNRPATIVVPDEKAFGGYPEKGEEHHKLNHKTSLPCRFQSQEPELEIRRENIPISPSPFHRQIFSQTVPPAIQEPQSASALGFEPCSAPIPVSGSPAKAAFLSPDAKRRRFDSQFPSPSPSPSSTNGLPHYALQSLALTTAEELFSGQEMDSPGLRPSPFPSPSSSFQCDSEITAQRNRSNSSLSALSFGSSAIHLPPAFEIDLVDSEGRGASSSPGLEFESDRDPSTDVAGTLPRQLEIGFSGALKAYENLMVGRAEDNSVIGAGLDERRRSVDVPTVQRKRQRDQEELKEFQRDSSSPPVHRNRSHSRVGSETSANSFQRSMPAVDYPANDGVGSAGSGSGGEPSVDERSQENNQNKGTITKDRKQQRNLGEQSGAWVRPKPIGTLGSRDGELRERRFGMNYDVVLRHARHLADAHQKHGYYLGPDNQLLCLFRDYSFSLQNQSPSPTPPLSALKKGPSSLDVAYSPGASNGSSLLQPPSIPSIPSSVTYSFPTSPSPPYTKMTHHSSYSTDIGTDTASALFDVTAPAPASGSSRSSSISSTMGFGVPGSRRRGRPKADSINSRPPSSEAQVEGSQGTEISESLFETSPPPELILSLQSWTFNPLHSTLDNLLLSTSLIFRSLFFLDGLSPSNHLPGGSFTSLHNLIISLAHGYHRRNGYHNFAHAVDVLQACYGMLFKMGLVPPIGLLAEEEYWLGKGDSDHNARKWKRARKVRENTIGKLLGPEDCFALLIAAIGHDVGHPGLSNAYMINAHTPLAEVFEDKSVLENFHTVTLIHMLRKFGFAFLLDAPAGTTSPTVPSLSQVEGSVRPSFRKILTESVLATDMSRHFGFVDKLKKKIIDRASGLKPLVLEETEDDLLFLCGSIIKCADLSNPTRPHSIAKQWTSALFDEWKSQAHVERKFELNITVVTFEEEAARDDAEFRRAQAKSQIGFLDIFVVPLFESMAGIVEDFDDLVDRLKEGRAAWENIAENPFFEATPCSTPEIHTRLIRHMASERSVRQHGVSRPTTSSSQLSASPSSVKPDPALTSASSFCRRLLDKPTTLDAHSARSRSTSMSTLSSTRSGSILSRTSSARPPSRSSIRSGATDSTTRKRNRDPSSGLPPVFSPYKTLLLTSPHPLHRPLPRTPSLRQKNSQLHSLNDPNAGWSDNRAGSPSPFSDSSFAREDFQPPSPVISSDCLGDCQGYTAKCAACVRKEKQLAEEAEEQRRLVETAMDSEVSSEPVTPDAKKTWTGLDEATDAKEEETTPPGQQARRL